MITMADLCRAVDQDGQPRQVEQVREAKGQVYVILAPSVQEPKAMVWIEKQEKENAGS